MLARAHKREQLTFDEQTIIQNLINRPLSASNFEEIITLSKLKNTLDSFTPKVYKVQPTVD